MVARAIVHRPAILFLDEPTVGPRPAEPHRPVGDPRRAARRGPDDPPDHPLHGGGRPALRPGGHHGPRPHPRPGHPRRPQAVGRRRHDRPGHHRRRPRCAGAGPRRAWTGATHAEATDGPVRLYAARRHRARCPGWSMRAEAAGFTVTDLSVDRAHPRDRVHQPHRQGAARMTHHRWPPAPPTRRPAPPGTRRRARAFGALLLRDLRVLRKNARQFVLRTIMQPLLLVFVFTYVFPKIGQGIGGSAQAPGRVLHAPHGRGGGPSIVFQGIQAVALPLVQEFGFTKEIEDRVMAPLPVWAVAVEKITVRRGPGTAGRAGRVPARHLHPRHARPPRRPLGLPADPGPRGQRRGRLARPGHRHPRRAPAGAAAVQHRDHPDDVPGRDLLPVVSGCSPSGGSSGWSCSTRSST